MVDVLDQIADKFVVTDDCWRWTAAIASTGYGVINTGGKVRGAHRVLYELLTGLIPEGSDLDHLCHNRWCVRPSHLEPCSRGENVRRGKAMITACPQSHTYDSVNTGFTKQGARYCRTCARERQRRKYGWKPTW